MKKLTIVYFFLFGIFSTAFSQYGTQNETCDFLKRYRDGELVELFDTVNAEYLKKNKKLIEQIDLQFGQVEDIKLIRRELASMKSKADWSGIPIATKMVAEFLDGVITPAMITSLKKGAIAGSLKRAMNIEEIKATLRRLSYENFEDALINEVLSINPVVSVISDLSQNIQLLNERDNTLQELKTQIDNLDFKLAELNNKLLKYKKALNDGSAKLYAINSYKRYIDEYLKDNCGESKCAFFSVNGVISKRTCGSSNGIEITITNTHSSPIKAFCSFQQLDGTWGRWALDGTWDDGILPGQKKTWGTCEGTGAVKVIGMSIKDHNNDCYPLTPENY